jgi:HAE1 family hydrophobic/amphiphilic exporter-1
LNLPPGYSAGEGTRWWKERENNTEMLVNLGLCLLLVYAVMASLFESFLQPVAIMLTCLLGCFGAPWAMYATDTTVDTVALIGLFILIGIAVNNGIILIDKSLQLRAQGSGMIESLCESGRLRLRPILMTASTTILGLIPMLVYHPTLAGIYYHSIAIIVAAGLLSSTLVTLLFLPAAYLLIDEHAANARALWRRFS